MHFSLDNFFQLLLPHLPFPLFSSEIIQASQKLAKLLPPIYCCGFECRLDSSQQIDFHQFIASIDNEPEKVIHHIGSSESLQHDAWARVKDFCILWMDRSSSLNNDITGIWLEFDQSHLFTYETVPNIFIRFKPQDSIQQNGSKTVSIIEKSLSLLAQVKLSGHMRTNLCLCLETGIDSAYISHFGSMLSRDLKTIRINIAGIQKTNILAYLDQLGLKEQSKKLGDIIEGTFPFFDRVVVCLDIGNRIGANVGLECFIDDQSNKNRSWSAVFDHFVEKDLCKTDKRDQILSWPGFMRPGSNSAKYWPDNLIIESMMRPENHFSCIYRRISHIKINYYPNKAIGLKAYFGAVHLWVTSPENSQPNVKK